MSRYFPAYSTIRHETVKVELNLSNYVTQKEFKNLTNVDTSDFALKTNVAKIKSKVDDIDVDKINTIDEIQGKNYVEEESYLYFEETMKYLTTYKASDNNTYVTSWQSRGKSNIKITPPISLTHKFSPIIFFANYHEIINFEGGYLKTDTTIYPKLYLPINIYFVFLSSDPPDTTITLANSL